MLYSKTNFDYLDMGYRAFKLSEYTIPNSPDCVFMRQIDAEIRFLQNGLVGPVSLQKVDDVNGVKHLMWTCTLPKEEVAYLPVFIDDFDKELPEVTDCEPATDQTFIYRFDRSYIVRQQKNGRMNVRLITHYWHQALVDAMCRAQGYVPQEIYPVRLYDLYSRTEEGICWQIVYKDGEQKDNGMILAVDLYEAPRLITLDVNKLDYLPIYADEEVVIRNVRYKFFQNEQGSYFLGRSLMQVLQKKH